MNQNPSTQLGAALSGEGRTDVGHGADAGIRGAVMPGFVSRPDAGSAASLRVLHVYKTYLPDSWGGLENAIFQICSSTGKLGIEHRIISLSRGDTRAISVRPEVEVHRYPVTVELASCPFSLAALQDFKSQIGWADVVHYHFPWPFADILDFQRAADRLPAIVTYHSDIVRQRLLLHLYRPLMYRMLTRSYCIIATSPNYLATSAELQKFRDKVSVIPLGLDEHSYPRPDGNRVDKWRARLGADFFLFIGVLRYYKGLHILIEAAQRTAATIVIVGSGPIENQLRKKAQRMGIKNVHFLGFVSEEDKIALLVLARALVFPSHLRAEAFGLSLLEAAMCGKPMISSEIGTGTSYVNIDGETGLVIPPGDAGKLVEAIERLRTDVALAQAMGSAARARYEKLFMPDCLGKAYAELYRKAAKSVREASASADVQYVSAQQDR